MRIPKFERGFPNRARLLKELLLLSEHLRDEVNVFINEDFEYVLIEPFYLPDGYEPEAAQLLILIHPDYPAVPGLLSPQYGVYLRGIGGKIRRNGRELGCEDSFHGGSSCVHADERLKDKGFYWLCFHKIRRWDENHDTLATIITMIDLALNNPEREDF